MESPQTTLARMVELALHSGSARGRLKNLRPQELPGAVQDLMRAARLRVRIEQIDRKLSGMGTHRIVWTAPDDPVTYTSWLTLCPVSNELAELSDQTDDFVEFLCPTCGRYRATRTVAHLAHSTDLLARGLLEALRRSLDTGDVPIIDKLPTEP